MDPKDQAKVFQVTKKPDEFAHWFIFPFQRDIVTIMADTELFVFDGFVTLAEARRIYAWFVFDHNYRPIEFMDMFNAVGGLRSLRNRIRRKQGLFDQHIDIEELL